MNELKIRLLSGLVYICLIIFGTIDQFLLWSVLAVFGICCVYELIKLTELNKKIPYLIFIVLFSGCIFINLYFKFKYSDIFNATYLSLVIIFNSFLLIWLFSKNRKILSKGLSLNMFYLTGGFVFLGLTSFYEDVFNPSIFLGCFIIVWINDSFAYLIGKNFGSTKLFPSISPKKTIEGFLGGLIFASLGSILLFYTVDILSLLQWILLSLIISVFGTLGDLIESKLKRQAQVKDSGSLMPGHGGLLDRLDSIIFASPFIYLFLIITAHVS